MTKPVAPLPANEADAVDLEHETERLLSRLDAYQTMACARWDHGLSAEEFGAVIDSIRRDVSVIHEEACRCGIR
jgi:hypothetical protein